MSSGDAVGRHWQDPQHAVRENVGDDNGLAEVGISRSEVADGECVGEGLAGQRFGSCVALGELQVHRHVVVHQGAGDLVALIGNHRVGNGCAHGIDACQRGERVAAVLCFRDGVALVGVDRSSDAAGDCGATDEEREVADNGISTIVVDDVLDDRDGRRLIVVGDGALNGLARRERDCGAASGHVEGVVRLDPIAHADRAGGDVTRDLNLADHQGGAGQILVQHVGGDLRAIDFQHEVADDCITAVVVDDVLDHGEAWPHVVVGDRADDVLGE